MEKQRLEQQQSKNDAQQVDKSHDEENELKKLKWAKPTISTPEAAQYALHFSGLFQPERQQISRQFFSGQGTSGAVLTGDEISTSDGKQQPLLPASTIGLLQSGSLQHKQVEGYLVNGAPSTSDIALRIHQRRPRSVDSRRIIGLLETEGIGSIDECCSHDRSAFVIRGWTEDDVDVVLLDDSAWLSKHWAEDFIRRNLSPLKDVVKDRFRGIIKDKGVVGEADLLGRYESLLLPMAAEAIVRKLAAQQRSSSTSPAHSGAAAAAEAAAAAKAAKAAAAAAAAAMAAPAAATALVCNSIDRRSGPGADGGHGVCADGGAGAADGSRVCGPAVQQPASTAEAPREAAGAAPPDPMALPQVCEPSAPSS